MSLTNRLLCREISTLEFNGRVLAQAQNESIPLLERLRFLCIVSSNLDEFFEVRVAWLKRQQRSAPNILLSNQQTPAQVIERVSVKAHQLINAQYELLNHTLLPQLAQQNILFYRRSTWTAEQKRWIESYFTRELLPILTPIGLDASHPFPRLLNKSLNFVVQLEGKDAFGRDSGMAIVQAPRILPRILQLPPELCNQQDGFVFLSSVVHEFVYKLFRGMRIKGCYQFRLTRDSSLTVHANGDLITNLRSAIQSELRDREFGDAVRLEVANSCPTEISDFLLAQFQLKDNELYRVDGPVNLGRMIAVFDILHQRNDLKYPPFTPQVLGKKTTPILDKIAKHDVLLHHPYQSFDPVVRFIDESAHDPNVVAIKMTIYRTGSRSSFARALMAAALAGKQVTVVVELMARFDEANNVNWANRLEEAGAHVVYGVVGYKIHAKMALVIRREEDGLKQYAHVATGNYHQGTSRVYTDWGLLTCNNEITHDLNMLFMEITGLGQATHLRRVYQSPFTLHKMLLDNIERERQHAEAGLPAQIKMKMNALLDPSIINALYEASQAGVQIDLIVRGMCVLRPQVAGLSENIRVRSIVGRLLEHSRVYYFHHNGAEELFIASADCMERNLFHRIEIAVPITQPNMKQRIIQESLEFSLKDNQNAWQMDESGQYRPIAPEDHQESFSAQENLLQCHTPTN